MNLLEYPTCNVLMEDNPDKIKVITQIVDKRVELADEDAEYPFMVGNHAIFVGKRTALNAIMSFERTLSEMLATPISTEYISYPIEDLVRVSYILLNPPEEEKPEEPESTEPEEPTEGDGEENTDPDISDNSVDVVEEVICNGCGSLLSSNEAIKVQEKSPDGKTYYYCSEECYNNRL